MENFGLSRPAKHEFSVNVYQSRAQSTLVILWSTSRNKRPESSPHSQPGPPRQLHADALAASRGRLYLRHRQVIPRPSFPLSWRVTVFRLPPDKRTTRPSLAGRRIPLLRPQAECLRFRCMPVPDPSPLFLAAEHDLRLPNGIPQAVTSRTPVLRRHLLREGCLSGEEMGQWCTPGGAGALRCRSCSSGCASCS
ncbi:hypothetical protein DFH07DRAFT_308951 [Mycena maculata]|uniref:Uncharacterized protein n=1 Tax=Mycena maculata TaxID=230809 RepID=A0AAD7HGA4_9AGAR|nr:hypothetical protein DFH07DRAFT_308951 [Mycena maculata]